MTILVGTAVAHVVAGDRRDDDVLQTQSQRRFGDTFGLVGLHGFGLTLRHGTEATRSRADVAQDHERRGLLRPTLGAIGALGAFADGFQVQLFDQLGRKVIGVAQRHVALEPLG